MRRKDAVGKVVSRPWIELDRLGQPNHEGFFEPERPEKEGVSSTSVVRSSRRGFLATLGAGAAGLAGCQRLPVSKAIPYLVPPEEITPGVPTHYASVCGECPSRCGIMSKVLDGRPVKIEGNPDHPASRGGLCAIGQAQIRELFDPGRITGPTIGGSPVEWAELDRQVRQRLDQAARGGSRVYVVARTITSPSARAAVEELLAPVGGTLVEHDLDPASPPALRDAYAVLDGAAQTVSLDLTRADVLVSFAADPFGVGPDPVGNTQAWSERKRAVEDEARPPVRHIQIESSSSLSGANADERWPATPDERQGMAIELLRLVAVRSDHPDAPALLEALRVEVPAASANAARLGALADELMTHRGRSLVMSGSNRLAEQLAVALLNRLLGNEGNGLRLTQAATPGPSDNAVSTFRDDLLAGRVGAAVFVDLDIVGRLPDGQELAEAIARLPLSVGVFRRPNPTASACDVVAPMHHSLEDWSDAIAPGGAGRTLAQPAVRPLFDTRSAWGSVASWSGAGSDWRRYLQDQWRQAAAIDNDAFDAAWFEAVRTSGLGGPLSGAFGAPTEAASAVADVAPAASAAVATAAGVVTGTSPAVEQTDVSAVLAEASAVVPVPAGEPQVEIVAGIGQRYGDHAHNPWLRELPDPVTRVSWAACARFAPARAAEMGVTDGDIVRLTSDGTSVELPVRVLPGQHVDVIGVPWGLPRTDLGGDAGALSAGAPTSGIQTDGAQTDGDASDIGAAFLRFGTRTDGGAELVWGGATVQVEATGARADLPIVQPHALTEGRPIVHQVSAVDDAVHGAHHVEASTWPERETTSPHWEMVIDLNACVGCSGCVVACQVENNVAVVGPEQMAEHRDMHWLRIDRYFVGEPDNPDVLFEPMMCPQCDNAPCETVCPVAATVHSEDGLNQQIYNRCVGTRYCANNCPYKVRRFNWFDFQPTDPVERMALNPDVVVRSRGVMEKCTFCVQRIQSARIDARRAGEPRIEVQTACEQSCPAQAIYFGDATDPDGDIARLKQKSRAFQVLAELGTKPSVTYLAKVRNRVDVGSDGAEGSAETAGHEEGATP